MTELHECAAMAQPHDPAVKLPWCCYIDDDGHCPNAAGFRIYTHRKDGSVAGPDIYADETDSCVRHVGNLLGWQPDATYTDEIVWTIYQLEDEASDAPV